MSPGVELIKIPHAQPVVACSPVAAALLITIVDEPREVASIHGCHVTTSGISGTPETGKNLCPDYHGLFV